MVFEQAWNIVKDVDFRIPKPTGKPPSYTDEDANLAFRGSKIPNWFDRLHPFSDDPMINPRTGDRFGVDSDKGDKTSYYYGRGGPEDESPSSVEYNPVTEEYEPTWRALMDASRFKRDVREGKIVVPPKRDYAIGDFTDSQRDFESSWIQTASGKDELLNELERASMVRALMDAGLIGERQIETALDEASFADSRGSIHSRTPFQETIRGGAAYRTNRLGGDDLNVDSELWDVQGWEEDD